MEKSNIHAGHRQRLKDLAKENGLDGMSSYQVLELLLYYAVPQKDTNVLAHRLIDTFGSLSAVLDTEYESLLTVNGVGAHTASLLTLMPALFRRYGQDLAGEKCVISNFTQAKEYVKHLFIGKTYEEFYLICLNNQLRVNKSSMLNSGSLNEVTIYPRVAVEMALRHKAKFILLAHNHPGGRAQPSSEDVKVTHAIRNVLEPMGIIVLDHLIYSGEDCFSFVEKGLLPRRAV